MERREEEIVKVLRGRVEGKEIYCRVPIRRKRTPISNEDIAYFEEMQKQGISDTDLLRMAYDLCKMGEYEFAGKIFSFIDMKKGEEFYFLETEENNDRKETD